MPQLSYRNFHTMRWTDVPTNTSRFQYSWNGPLAGGVDPATQDFSGGLGSNYTIYDPIVYNHIAYPIPGNFRPPNGFYGNSYPAGITNPENNIVFTSGYNLNTAITPRQALVTGNYEVNAASLGTEMRFTLNPNATDPNGPYILDTFTDPYRQGWTVEYWAYHNRNYYSYGLDNPSIMTIGTGSALPGQNENTVPFFRVCYNLSGLGATSDAPSGVPNTNGVLVRVGGRAFYTPFVPSFSNQDLGHSLSQGRTKAVRGWHHVAVVEDRTDSTFRIFIDGELAALYTGVNMNIPMPTVNQTLYIGAANNTSTGRRGNRSMVLAELNISKYPKYKTAFTVPFANNFTMP